ncbi:protein rep [Actinomycetospora soli]|uniref:protein rep n=1 Tax=Actinomycetospora soli TaxID=2893887 RepID=UPI001E2DB2BD|nr:protein rep [Actinomycetospora soli]MCD2191651.1 protein rep [Actinomycetospora soli]
MHLASADAGRTWHVAPRARVQVDRTDPVAVQDARDDHRTERYAIRRGLRRVWRNDRVTGCGRAGARPDGEVVVRYSPATAATGPVTGFSGLLTCGNVWLCPECSGKVSAHRAARIERALTTAVDRGGWAVLITLTTRHRLGIPLGVLLSDGVQAGWRAVGKSRAVRETRKRLGVLGIVRAVEITHGPNGWHPHVHALVVFAGRPPRSALDALGAAMFRAWSAAIAREGLPAPIADSGGLDVSHLGTRMREGTLASLSAWAAYAAKGITGEAIMGAVKDAKGRNRSIRELMRDGVLGTRWESSDGRAAVTTDDTAVELLREYEIATKAVKQLTGVTELERALGLDEDTATDEEIAAAEAGGEDVAVIAGGYWDTLVEPVAADLAAAGERFGPDGIRRWLTRRGVPWTWPTGSARTWETIREDRDQDTARILAAAGVGSS